MFSVVLGTALIACAVFVTIFASFQYIRRIRELQRGVQEPGTPSKLALSVAFILAAAGLATAIYIGAHQATPQFRNGVNAASSAMEPGTAPAKK